MADKLTAELYAADGTDMGTVDLNPDVFGIEPNVPVMHQVVTAQLAARQEKFIRSLENALLRIKNKTYGVCRVTGNN